jgi:hypothetical protein
VANSAQGQADFYRDRRGQQCRSCSSVLTGRTFGGQCSRCYQRAKTWGDAGQRPIYCRELKTEWFPRVLQLRALAPKVDWVAIGERWQIIIDRAHVKVGERYTSSRELAANKHEKAAAAVLIDFARGMNAQEALNLTTAAYVMRDTRPGSYRSDKALWCVIIAAMRVTSQGTTKAPKSPNGTRRPRKKGTSRPPLNRTTRAILTSWIRAAYESPAVALVELGRKQDAEHLGRQVRSRDAMAELSRAAGISLPSYQE